MNINNKSAFRECTSCQICGAVCPTQAISIQLNEDGFYRPYVDEKKCIDCGLCVKSCYKFDTNIHETESPDSYLLFAASAKNKDVCAHATSGGVADVLVQELIRQGYKCIGVAYDAESNRAKGVVAHDYESAKCFRGSKYIQSLSIDAFRVLVDQCKSQKFAVFGLPCQIYAIDRVLRAKGCRENHLLVDLYCHGCPTLNLWRKYVDTIVKHYNAKNVISANFRSKVRGWGNFSVEVVVEGVTSPIEAVSPRTGDHFYELFFSDLVLNDSCSDCKLRGTLEYADIRLGDFWGHTYVMNNKGVSAVSIMTPHGIDAFDSIGELVNAGKQQYSSLLPYQSYGKNYNIDCAKRKMLLFQLADDDVPLSLIVKTFHHSLDKKSTVKRYCKNAIKLAPSIIISIAKCLYYFIKGKCCKAL